MDRSDLCTNCNHRPDRVMTPEQFTQVIEAILAGKYSWACVLILRFAGYNPLHYIPYRTYNRLQKEHEQAQRAGKAKGAVPTGPTCLNQFSDLAYLEVLPEAPATVRGGRFTQWVESRFPSFASCRKGC
jgi:hypothetical protein